jgi:hypothetical protein
MAGVLRTLLSCPACFYLISIEADVCRNCGQPLTEEIKDAMRAAAREQQRNPVWQWLISNATKYRDLVLVVAALTYPIGFLIWSIHAWKQDLGLLPVINSQYIMAGLFPLLFLGGCGLLVYLELTLVKLSRKAENKFRTLLEQILVKFSHQAEKQRNKFIERNF